jgi:heptosyltransferase I
MQGARTKPLDLMGDDVRRLIWILDTCAAVVAPDTGPLHIARALGTPVVGLFGHTNPWRVGPYQAYQDLWLDAYTDAGATPDPAAATPKDRRMETISAEAVIEKVARALAQRARSTAAEQQP